MRVSVQTTVVRSTQTRMSCDFNWPHSKRSGVPASRSTQSTAVWILSEGTVVGLVQKWWRRYQAGYLHELERRMKKSTTALDRSERSMHENSYSTKAARLLSSHYHCPSYRASLSD
jgi:hypothetical protein